MHPESIIRVKCRPPHKAYFVILGLTILGFCIWWFFEPDQTQKHNIAGGIVAVALVTSAIWFTGMYLPYRNCRYEISDSEIRIIRARRQAKVIPFSSITTTRVQGHALIILSKANSPTYLYPGSASKIIVQRISLHDRTKDSSVEL